MEEIRQEKKSLMFWVYLAAAAAGIMLSYEFEFTAALLFLPAFMTAAAFRGKNGPGVFFVFAAVTVLYGLYLGYDALFALRILLLTLPSALILYACHRFRIGSTNAALMMAPAIALGLFVIFCGNALLSGQNAYAEVRVYFSAVFSPIMSMLPAGSDLAATFQFLLGNIESIFPAFVYILGAIYAFTSTVLLQLLNRRKKLMPLVPMRSPQYWALPPRYLLACFLAIAASFVLEIAGASFSEPFMLLAYFMLNMPLGVAGASALYMLITLKNDSRGRRLAAAAVILVLTVSGIGGYIFPVLGFFKCGPLRRKPESRE